MKTHNRKNQIAFLLLSFILSSCGPKDEPFEYCPSNESLSEATGDPTVLIIGDSISIGYTPEIALGLSGFDVVHNPCNAMTSTWTASQIDLWLASRPSFEAITFNNGLWDLADWINTPIVSYRDNLHLIAQKIKAKTTKPLFVLTTEVLPGTPNRIDANVLAYNQAAIAVMALEGIPVLDLYSVSQTIQHEHSNPNDVHFTESGSSTLGQAILNELNVLYGIN